MFETFRDSRNDIVFIVITTRSSRVGASQQAGLERCSLEHTSSQRAQRTLQLSQTLTRAWRVRVRLSWSSSTLLFVLCTAMNCCCRAVCHTRFMTIVFYTSFCYGINIVFSSTRYGLLEDKDDDEIVTEYQTIEGIIKAYLTSYYQELSKQYEIPDK